MVTLVADATVEVVTVKVAESAPAATVTDAGTEATLAFELDRETTAPPAGAAAVSVTVPVERPPPTTLEGDRLTEESVTDPPAGVTVSTAVFVTPL